MARRAAARILSESATLVPPNFWTRRGKVVAPRGTPSRIRAEVDPNEFPGRSDFHRIRELILALRKSDLHGDLPYSQIRPFATAPPPGTNPSAANLPPGSARPPT